MKAVEMKGNLKKWNGFVGSKKEFNIFHSPEWAGCVESYFGYKAKHFMLEDDGGRIKAAIPLFLIKTIFGTKLATCPFNFYTESFGSGQNYSKEAVGVCEEIAEKAGAEYIEYKCKSGVPDSLPSRNHYSYSEIALPRKIGPLFFGKTIRKRLRRCEREGIEISRADSLSELREFHDLMTEMYARKHNTIAQPFGFIDAVWKAMRKKYMSHLVLVYHKGKMIGGNLIFDYNNKFFGAWCCSDIRKQHLYPNYPMIYNIIWFGVELGRDKFDVGLSSPNQPGLTSFKESWGADTFDLPYSYSLMGGAKMPKFDYNSSFRGPRSLIRFMPKAAAKAISPLVIRQFG